jgi:signal transduction histidine kinase
MLPVHVAWRSLGYSLASFLPLALMVLWLSASERVLTAELVWNDSAQAVCIQTQPCTSGVVAVRGANSQVSVDAGLLLDAGHFLPTYALRTEYAQRHLQLHSVLQAETVELLFADGSIQRHQVTSRGWLGISAMLWMHVALGYLAWLSGCFHWLRSGAEGLGLLLTSCGGYAVGMLLGGLELDHGLAWPMGAAGLINQLARFAIQLGFAAYVGFVLCLPRRVVPRRVVQALPATAFLVVCIDVLGLAPAPAWGHQAVVALWVVLVSVALFYQWRRTHSPLLRALAQWFGLLAGLLVLRFAIIQAWPQDGSTTERELFVAGSFMAFKVFSLMVMAVSPVLGNADHVWRRIVLWLLAASLVAAADVVLILALRLSPPVALLVSTLLVGAFYVPLRAWAFERLLGNRTLKLEDHIEALYITARAAATSDARAQQSWAQLLQRAFAPEELALRQESGPSAQVREGGAALWAPLPVVGGGVLLRHAHGGRRLFGAQERRFVDQAAKLLARLVDADRKADLARQEERERIANDLHDDLGGRLLHLVRTGPPGPWQRFAQDTLSEMRFITHGMAKGPVPLNELLADLRGELAPRVRAVGLQMDWQAPGGLAVEPVRPEMALAIARVLSEALRNAVTHGQATRLSVDIGIEDARLCLRVRNDGPRVDPAVWSRGLGLLSIERRAQQLGGQARWEALAEGGVLLTVSWPMHYQATAP